MSEIISAKHDPATATTADTIEFMVDQSHNIEGKIEAMIESVINIQTAYAKALLVDRATLREAQIAGDVLGAHMVLIDAYETESDPCSWQHGKQTACRSTRSRRSAKAVTLTVSPGNAPENSLAAAEEVDPRVHSMTASYPGGRPDTAWAGEEIHRAGELFLAVEYGACRRPVFRRLEEQASERVHGDRLPRTFYYARACVRQPRPPSRGRFRRDLGHQKTDDHSIGVGRGFTTLIGLPAA